jgi:hypothetical protein
MVVDVTANWFRQQGGSDHRSQTNSGWLSQHHAYLVVAGAKLIDFMKQGSTRRKRWRMAGPDGGIAHAEVSWRFGADASRGQS